MPSAERSTESDATLVTRTRQGDRAAFDRLVARYERPAVLAAGAILHCWHDARDCAQEAFVTAYLKLNRLWRPHRFGGWLMQIVRHQALAELRRRKARPPVSADLPDRATESPATGWGISDELAELIGRLPEQECVVVTLRHVEEMTVAEIAAITGRPVGTVTKQLSRAYARMRPWLQADEQLAKNES